ncbi:hypothetical protein [Pseudomonas sp. LB3P14]
MLLGHTLGLLNGVQGATFEHDPAGIAGFGALLDLVVRDDPTHVDPPLLLVGLVHREWVDRLSGLRRQLYGLDRVAIDQSIVPRKSCGLSL